MQNNNNKSAQSIGEKSNNIFTNSVNSDAHCFLQRLLGKFSWTGFWIFKFVHPEKKRKNVLYSALNIQY